MRYRCTLGSLALCLALVACKKPPVGEAVSTPPDDDDDSQPEGPLANPDTSDAGAEEAGPGDPDCSNFEGHLTFRNTVEPLLRRRCAKCHAGSYTTRGVSELYSVIPQDSTSDWVRSWEGFRAMASSACDFVADGTMPPSQSEERLSDEDIATFATFCESLESMSSEDLEGSAVPSVTAVMDNMEWTVASSTSATVLTVPLEITTVDSDDSELQLRVGIDSDRSDFDGTLLIECDTIDANATRMEILDADNGLSSAIEQEQYNVYVCVSDGSSVYCDYADGRLEVAPNRDRDGDGIYLADGDCDDGSSSIGSEGTSYYLDTDGDSFGDEATLSIRCMASNEWTEEHSDCNDACETCYPGATEICDLLDNDCDGQADEGLEASRYYLDEDGDGYSGATEGQFCVPPAGATTEEGADCDDSNPAIHPVGEESRDTSGCSDGVDNDCDLAIDSHDPGCAPPESCDERDNDGDGTIDEGCSFSEDIAPLLADSCTASSCHGGSNPRRGLDLRANQYGQLVNFPAETSEQGWDRVEPGSSASSYLYYQITIRSMGGLSADQRELLRIWIDSGAPNN